MPGTLQLPVSTGQAPRPAVRVLPVPRSEPPSDEELRAAGIDPPPANAPLLPLELPGEYRVRRRARRGHERTAANHLTAQDGQSTGMSSQVGTPTVGGAGDAAPPSPCRGATLRFLAVVFEVAGGFRPVAQLRGLCRPDRFDDISWQVTGRHPTRAGVPAGSGSAGRATRVGGFVPPGALIRGGRAPIPPRAPTGGPPRGARVDSRGPAARIIIRRLYICDINEEAAEISVVLARGTLIWAVAARMELVSGRWVCAHLETI